MFTISILRGLTGLILFITGMGYYLGYWGHPPPASSINLTIQVPPPVLTIGPEQVLMRPATLVTTFRGGYAAGWQPLPGVDRSWQQVLALQPHNPVAVAYALCILAAEHLERMPPSRVASLPDWNDATTNPPARRIQKGQQIPPEISWKEVFWGIFTGTLAAMVTIWLTNMLR